MFVSSLKNTLKPKKMSNVINWFEIPAANFDRASAFYTELLGGTVQKMENPEMNLKMGFLPGHEPGQVGGAIVEGEGYVPSETGSLIYLSGGEDLSGPLAKVEKAGGKVIVPKTAIGENGFIAQFIDTEGNRIAFHSMS